MTDPTAIALKTVTLTYGKGYAGKMGNKCWIARIGGTDKQYGLRREFIEPDKVEREHFNRPRTTITMTWDLPVGLYELSQHGERWFRLIAPSKTDGIGSFVVSDARIKAYVAALDDGQDDDAARKASKGL